MPLLLVLAHSTVSADTSLVCQIDRDNVVTVGTTVDASASNVATDLEAMKHDAEELFAVSDVDTEALTVKIRNYRLILALVIICMVVAVVANYRYFKRRRRLEDQNKQHELTEKQRYISGLECERCRLAKELHDGVTNDLLGLEMKLSAINDDSLKCIIEDISKIRASVRNISHELMPPEFSHLGLDEILGYYIKDVVGNGGVEMTFTTDNTQPVGSVPEKIAYEVYRIAQELLSNIVKHSQATKADITLRTISPGRHCLEIKDNGLEWDGNSKTIGAGTQTLLDRAASIRAVIKFSRKDNLNLKTIIFNS